MKIREPDPVDDHRLPWLTIHLVVAGRQKTSNLALGPILVLVILGSVAVELGCLLSQPHPLNFLAEIVDPDLCD